MQFQKSKRCCCMHRRPTCKYVSLWIPGQFLDVLCSSIFLVCVENFPVCLIGFGNLWYCVILQIRRESAITGWWTENWQLSSDEYCRIENESTDEVQCRPVSTDTLSSATFQNRWRLFVFSNPSWPRCQNCKQQNGRVFVDPWTVFGRLVLINILSLCR